MRAKRKSKIKRAVILALCVYALINGLVYGLLKAYLNSHNTQSREQWKMASVVKNGQAADITVLDSKFTVDISSAGEGISAVCIYSVMTDKAKTAARIITLFGRRLEELIDKELSSEASSF